MARVVFPGKWAGALMRQRGSLRTYQWLWIVLCTASALLAAAPRILAQPVVFTTMATVQVQPGRGYSSIVKNGDTDPDFTAVRGIAVEMLKLQNVAGQLTYPNLGTPTLNVSFAPHADGRVLASATSATPAQAQQLANDAAEALARSIRAAGGREVYRQLAGWEQNVAYESQPPRTPFQETLRFIIKTDSFPLNRSIDLRTKVFTVDQLSREDVLDLICALEVRYNELSLVDLPAMRPRLDTLTGNERAQLQNDITRLELGLQSIKSALDFLQKPQSLPNASGPFDPNVQSVVYRSVVAAPGSEVDRRVAPLLALAAMVGLVLGLGSVAVDHSAHLMDKVRDLWAYRELIRNLVLRDLRVRYKASALGYLWTQIAPLLTMLVFVFVFSKLQPNRQIALFSVFLLVGLLPWNFCAEAISNGTRSIIDNASLIKKVFFPREVLPLVSVLSSLVNYVLSLPMMLLVMIVVEWLYPPLNGHLNFSWTFAYLPVIIVVEMLMLLGIVLFLSALAVFFRDAVHLIGILIQFWFFLTPVVYPLDGNFSESTAQIMRWLNPMASIVEFYRETLYGRAVSSGDIPTPALPALDSVLRVLVTALVLLAFGYWFFQRQSGRFGEEI